MRIDFTDKSLWRATYLLGEGGTAFTKPTPNGHIPSTGSLSPLDFECDIEPKNQLFALKFYANLFISHVGLSENFNKKIVNKIITDIKEAILDENIKCILVVTGTDALEQVARKLNKKKFLVALIKERKVKVILTGANRRLTRKDTDGWDNFKSAFENGHREDIAPGVYVEFHDRLIPAELVTKEIFNGIEMNFTSYEDMNYIDSVRRESETTREIIRGLSKLVPQKADKSKMALAYPVNVIRSHQRKLRKRLTTEMPSAALLTLYHSSTANTDPERPVASVSKVIEDYRDQTVFFAVTENKERVNLNPSAYETSTKLGEAGLIPLGTMNQRVALFKLKMCAGMTRAQMIDTMTTKNLVGELDEESIDRDLIERQKALYL